MGEGLNIQNSSEETSKVNCTSLMYKGASWDLWRKVKTSSLFMQSSRWVALLVGPQPGKLMVDTVERLGDASLNVWQLIFLSENGK